MMVLIALPAIGSTTMIGSATMIGPTMMMDSDMSAVKLPMGMMEGMHAVHPDRLESSNQTLDQAEDCHQMEETKSCTEECGCCVAHVFPVSTSSIVALSFSRSQIHFHHHAITNADAKRLIRPPIYI